MTYWLLDVHGALICTVTADVGHLHYSENYLLYFTVDDEGSILVHAVDRPIDDAEALLRLEAITDSERD